MIVENIKETFGLHSSLILPIGAKSKNSIEKYVGKIEEVIVKDNAFLVSFDPLEPPNDLPVWNHQRSPLLNHSKQIWVDVDYRNYRKLYLSKMHNIIEDKSHVIDHIMNRKLARFLGYRFVRLLHVDRDVNSSSGRGGETYAIENLEISLRINPEINSSEIVYADPMDLLKMLNVKVGGFGLDAVRDNHYLFY